MSEEEKAINILKNMTTNYSLSGEQLHYVNILYYLIINLQQENNQLKQQRQELRSWLEDKIHNIVPEGCGINYNCEYDSEEDYVRAMEERSSLHTLKDTLDKLNELEGGKNE